MGNCIPLGNNVDFGFSGFIYRNIPAFNLAPGDKVAFDTGSTNNVNIRRNIYFAVANANPSPRSSCADSEPSQGIRALAWAQIVSDTQIPLSPQGNNVKEDYELVYTAEQAFSFPGGGLIVGFGGSPPGAYADSGCDQVLVKTTCNDPSGFFYSRFCIEQDQTLDVLDDASPCSGRGSELGGIVIQAAGGACGNGASDPGEECDQGAANGTSTSCCNLDCTRKAAGTECRPAAGACDVAESCDGSSGVCPADGFLSSSTVCRVAVDACDAAETCSGPGPTCPADGVKAANTPCTPDGNDCTQDICDGIGVACTHPNEPVNAPCGDPSDTDCTNPDTCDGNGTCLANDEAANTPCGSPNDTECDNPDTCDGTGNCQPNYEPANTTCGDPSDTDCTNPDTCDGAGTCQANHESANTPCTPDANDCTQDVCDSGGTCTHPPEPANTPCGDPSDTECTDPDTCNGAGVCLPNNVANGTPCSGTNNNTCLNACQTGVCGGAFIANCCGNGTLEGSEGCDDGNQNSTDGCSDRCILELDHFQCYRSRIIQPQPPIADATLLDQFGSLAAAVHRPRDLCTPANKNGEDPTAPAHPDHLQTYRIVAKQPRLLRQRLPERNSKVVNQFGTLRVDVIWPNRLLVPTAKNLNVLPPAPANPAVDHFTCYKVKRPRSGWSFTPIPNVALEDQFGPTTVTLIKPTRLCAPANKNNEEPGADTHIGHLLCYKIRGSFTPVGRAFTNNQFGPGIIYPRFLDELCVPSVKNPQ